MPLFVLQMKFDLDIYLNEIKTSRERTHMPFAWHKPLWVGSEEFFPSRTFYLSVQRTPRLYPEPFPRTDFSPQAALLARDNLL